jgi:hypothetical protein
MTMPLGTRRVRLALPDSVGPTCGLGREAQGLEPTLNEQHRRLLADADAAVEPVRTGDVAEQMPGSHPGRPGVTQVRLARLVRRDDLVGRHDELENVVALPHANVTRAAVTAPAQPADAVTGQTALARVVRQLERHAHLVVVHAKDLGAADHLRVRQRLVRHASRLDRGVVEVAVDLAPRLPVEGQDLVDRPVLVDLEVRRHLPAVVAPERVRRAVLVDVDVQADTQEVTEGAVTSGSAQVDDLRTTQPSGHIRSPSQLGDLESNVTRYPGEGEPVYLAAIGAHAAVQPRMHL